MDTPLPTLTTLQAYLDGRNELIAGREVLFSAVRTYLRPGQHPDAQLLGDPFWDSPARDIAEEEWIANAARGYLTILESPSNGRSFRINVLQQGNALHLGVHLPAWHSELAKPALRIQSTFEGHPPLMRRLDTDGLLIEWRFSAEKLYTHAQEMEDAVFRIGALFEEALQALTPKSKASR